MEESVFAVIAEDNGKGATALSLLSLTGKFAFRYRAGVFTKERNHRFAIIEGMSIALEVDSLPMPLKEFQIRLVVAREDGAHLIVEREAVEGGHKGEFTVSLSDWRLRGPMDFVLNQSVGYDVGSWSPSQLKATCC